MDSVCTQVLAAQVNVHNVTAPPQELVGGSMSGSDCGGKRDLGTWWSSHTPLLSIQPPFCMLALQCESALIYEWSKDLSQICYICCNNSILSLLCSFHLSLINCFLISLQKFPSLKGDGLLSVLEADWNTWLSKRRETSMNHIWRCCRKVGGSGRTTHT